MSPASPCNGRQVEIVALPATDNASRPACLRVILAAAGIKVTRQRLALADRILGRHRHFTAADLFAECAGVEPVLSLATIYNTLAQFEEHGLVRALLQSGGQSIYDSNTEAHHHYLIEETGEVIDIPNSATIHVQSAPQPPRGFVLDRIEVMVRVRQRTDAVLAADATTAPATEA